MDSKTTNNIINKWKEVRELFNKVRDNLSRKETKTVRNKLYKKESIYNFFKRTEHFNRQRKDSVEEYW